MANNCLLTKLKVAVQNDNLPKLGVLRLNLVAPATYNINIAPASGKTVQLIVLDNKHVEIDGVSVSEKILTYNTGIKIIENATIELKSKYDIASFGSFMGNNKLNTSDLLTLSSLNSIVRCTLYGSILELAELLTLTTLGLYNTPDGNFEDYSEDNYKAALRAMNVVTFSRIWCTQHELSFEGACLPDTIESVYFGDGSYKGSIESFVVGIRSNGRTSGTMTVSNNGNSNVTFNNAAIGDVSGKTLSWTASTITFDGVTISA